MQWLPYRFVDRFHLASLCAVLELNLADFPSSTCDADNIRHRSKYSTEFNGSIFYVRVSSYLEYVKIKSLNYVDL